MCIYIFMFALTILLHDPPGDLSPKVYCLYNIFIFGLAYVVYVTGKKILDSVVGNEKSLKGIGILRLQRRRNMAHVTGEMVEKEYELWKASKDYINGEITMDKLEEIESSYNKDFNSAMVKFAKSSIQRNLIDIIQGKFFVRRKKT
jgi:hypothetical protein